MPAPVDHDARRWFVVAGTSDYIAQFGLEATTIRTVAKAAGYSASITTHYFDDKEHLLKATYLDIVERRLARLSKITQDGIQPLRTALLAMLPMDERTRKEWLVYCALLGSGVAKNELASTQAMSIENSTSAIKELIRSEISGGSLVTDKDPAKIAYILVVFIIGLGVMSILGPDYHEPDHLRVTVNKELAKIGYIPAIISG